MGYRRITRGRKAPGSKGKGNGTSKFKTRYRKMSGGDEEVKYPTGATLKLCMARESHLGGDHYNDPKYDMHGYEDDVNNSIQGKSSKTSSANSKRYVIDPEPHMLRSSSKVGQGLKTEYVSRRMRMGFFNQSTFFFQRASLFNIGLIEILKNNPKCIDIPRCKDAFFDKGHDVSVIHSNTAYVFFGGFAKKRGTISYEGVKQGLGLCYNVVNAPHGRLYMGYWFQDKMHGLGIEVDFDCSDPTKPAKPVGIYFGDFFLGKRKGFGIYYYVEDGKEKFVFYTGDQENKCVISASYADGDRNRQLFEETVRGTLKMNFVEGGGRDTRQVTLESYIEKLRAEFKKFIDSMGSMITKLIPEDQVKVLRVYQPVYKTFVDFCFDSVYTVVHDAYVAARDKETIANKAKLEAEEARKKARELVTAEDGIQIIDTNIARARQDEIDKCVIMLTKEEHYQVKSPKELQEEAAAAKTQEFENVKKKAETLEQERHALMQRSITEHEGDGSSPFTVTVGTSRSPRRYRETQSPTMSPRLSPRNLEDSFHEASSEHSHLLHSRGGSKRTRKNMRMRMRRVKSRRSRRGGSQCGMRQ